MKTGGNLKLPQVFAVGCELPAPARSLSRKGCDSKLTSPHYKGGMMREIKELEEALKETVKLLELSSLVSLALSYYHIDTDEAGLHLADIARQHLNLKGKNWKIAIVEDIKSTYHSDTTDKALKFPIRQVVWEAK